MTRLLIVRHGETESNKKHALVGRSQTELTPYGLKQARALAKRLEKEEISVIYCSTLKRAIQTAEEIAKFHSGVKIIQTPALDERDFGEAEGLTKEELVAKNPEYQKLSYDTNLAPPGGESSLQMVARIKPFLEKIESKHPDETVVVVAHGGTNGILLSLLLKTPLEHCWNIKQENVCINEFKLEKQGGHQVIRINDTSHLEPLRDTLDNEI